MSHSPDVKRQYGIVTAIGSKLGEAAKESPESDPIARIRAAPDLDAFRALVREAVGTRAPANLLATFLDEVVQPDDWVQWRSRLLLQAKMVRDGQKPAEDHRSGRGVGGP